jgi:hypothetical protein
MTTETTENSFNKARRKLVTARIEFIGQLAKFSTDELELRPIEDEWSPLQLAHHVYIAEGMVLEQLKLVQNEENPLVVNVSEQAPRVTETSEPPVSLEAVLSGMAARREEVFEYLAALPEDAWMRPFRRTEGEDRKFYQMVNILALHDQQHAQQLAKIKAALS